MSSSSAGRNALLMRDQIKRARLVKADKKVTVMQIMHCNGGMQKSISEHTTHQTFKWIGYSCRSVKTVKISVINT